LLDNSPRLDARPLVERAKLFRIGDGARRFLLQGMNGNAPGNGQLQEVEIAILRCSQLDIDRRDRANSRWSWRPTGRQQEKANVFRRNASAQKFSEQLRVVAEKEQTAHIRIDCGQKILPGNGTICPPLRDNSAEALVAGAVSRQKNEAPRLGFTRISAKLNPGDRANAAGARGLMEPHLSGNILHVHQRDRRVLKASCRAGELRGVRAAAARGVFALRQKKGKVVHRSRASKGS
jgi:hypothetical protein